MRQKVCRCAIMKNIILIGMPGTGKSVVGRALADRLHYTFVDVDDLIVASRPGEDDTASQVEEVMRTARMCL